MKRINLLPQHKQTDLYYENLFHGVFVAVILASIILLMGVAAQVFAWIYLDQKAKTVAEEITVLKQQVDKGENAEQKQLIRQINAQMGDFENLSKNAPQWSGVLEAFAKQVPEGIRINQFSADTKTGEVDISGYGPTREKVIELYNNINADKDHFQDINYPLENVSKPVDIQFNFTFLIKEGILVPKP